jgi:beta-glucanase (GH16 family)
MRKLFNLILVAAVLTACTTPTPDPVNISITPATVQMKVGDITTLEVTGATANIEWSTSNDEVASIYHGVVTAKAIGKADITAKVGNATANSIVYVTGTDGASLRISPAKVNMRKGETYQFSYGNTYDLDMTWTSSDPSVATVTQDGLVTAVASGNATITLSTSLESVTALVAVTHKWGEYALVWSDEFDGTALDESVWNYNIGGSGWGNNEKQYYTSRPENIRVQNGCLEIEARKETYQNNEYTSARIHSKGKKEFKYGKMEARIKFPGGAGTWPAYWMLGNQGNWPNCGEIDIIEHVGSIDRRASFALHTAAKNGTKGNNWAKTQWFDYNLSDDFHIYGIEWAQEESEGKDVIRFFVDGVQYAEAWEEQIDNNDYWPFFKPHYFIFNLALGGNMGGQIDDTIFNTPRIMYVDWLRVYQRQEAE